VQPDVTDRQNSVRGPAFDLPQSGKPENIIELPCHRGARAMVMTSDVVRHELSRIEALIAVLGNGAAISDDDVEDLYWLTEQQIYLRALLAARRAQRGQRLVSLMFWRDGWFNCAGRSIAAAA
jgi:hypothetical protein